MTGETRTPSRSSLPHRVARTLLAVGLGGLAAVTPIRAALAQPAPADRPVLVVAHRGASKAAPEHTGAANDLAVRAGADVLECDLQLTADDVLVCLHDTTVDRTTGGASTGRVDSFTLEQLRAMDFGTWFGASFAGARVFTLEEQIRCYRGADPELQFYVETKEPSEYGGRMEPLLVDLLRRLDLLPAGESDVRTSPVIVQSFDAGSLASIRQLAPSLPTALLFNLPTPEIEQGQLPAVDVLVPNVVYLQPRPELIERAHAAGLEVHTWTVDDPALMATLIDQGIDGFFTNEPTIARTAVDAKGRSSGRSPQVPTAAGPDDTTPGPGCPAGMGIGIEHASTGAGTSPAGPGATGSAPPSGATPNGPSGGTATAASSDGGSAVPLVGVGLSVLLLGGITAVVLSRRKRPDDAPGI